MRILSIVSFLLLVCEWIEALKVAQVETFSTAESTLCIGHRGTPLLLPENSLPALTLALTLGGDGIETDLRVTRDGQLVLMHDLTLDRTSNGTGYIHDRDWSGDVEYVQLNHPSVPIPQLANWHVPTLEQILALISNTPGKILVLDIKDDNPEFLYPLLGDVLNGLYRQENGADVLQRISVGLWTLRDVTRLAHVLDQQVSAQIRWMLITSSVDYAFVSQLFVQDFSLNQESVQQWFLDCIQYQRHRQFYVWTVNEADQMNYWMDLKVTGVLTDNLPLCLATKAGRE